MTHRYRYLTPILLVALVSACSEDDTPARPDVSAAGSGGTSSVTGSAGTSSATGSSAPSSAAAGASSVDRPSPGASLGNNNAGRVGSQGSRGGGRFRDDPVVVDAGLVDGGDLIDAGDADAGEVDAGEIDASVP